MSRFGDEPHAFFDAVYQDTPPWEVGGPQPDLVSLFDDRPPEGPVLDLGCGSGDLTIALARRGLEVVGVDFVESAIDRARRKASSLPGDVARLVEFVVADGLRPASLGRRFGSVVDSGFLHLFEPDRLAPFVSELAEALRVGGRYYLLAFAVEFPPPSPRAVNADELRRLFRREAGWRILTLGPAEFRSRIATVPAIRACVQRSAEPGA